MQVIKEGTVYQVTFFPRLFPVNCYFVEEAESLTLVDAALPNSAKAILLAARRIGKPISRIVLTHAHGDHVGAIDALKGELPDAAVYISRRDAKLLSGDRSLEPGEPNTPVRGGVPKGIKTTADIHLEDGDRIQSLLAIASPGHTPGSMSFLDTRSGVLIAGDAFQTRGGIAVSGQIRPLFPFPAMATWNKQLSIESACKLKEVKPSVLAVGHGSLLKDPAAAMSGAIEKAKRHMTTAKESAQ